MQQGQLEALVARAQQRWKLTARHVDVLELVARGCSNAEIASALRISERTVEVHLTAIFVRTKCRSRAALIAAVWAG